MVPPSHTTENSKPYFGHLMDAYCMYTANYQKTWSRLESAGTVPVPTDMLVFYQFPQYISNTGKMLGSLNLI